MFRNEWFDGRMAVRTLPPECVSDIARPGPADASVDHWVQRLAFDGPAWLVREHLSGYGAWDRAELCDHQQNLRRLLWVWANDIAENGDEILYLMR